MLDIKEYSEYGFNDEIKLTFASGSKLRQIDITARALCIGDNCIFEGITKIKPTVSNVNTGMLELHLYHNEGYRGTYSLFEEDEEGVVVNLLGGDEINFKLHKKETE